MRGWIEVPSLATRRFLSAAAFAAVGLLSACGGGGGGGDTTPAPTQPPAAALPDAVTISATPATDVETTLQFKPSNDVSVAGLSYAWTFGDGETSALPQPSHKYAKGGDYRVELTVSNSASQSRTASFNVSLDNKSHLAGLECSEPNQAGWCRVYPPQKRVDFKDVKFPSASVGWAAGTSGNLLKTTDGGAHWSLQSTGIPASMELSQLLVYDAQTLWAWDRAGYGDLVMTVDGGASWKSVGRTVVNNNYLQSITVHSRQGLVATMDGTSFVSRDGGATWSAADSKVQWVQPNGTLWRVDAGQVSRSADLGTTFQPVPSLAVAAASTLSFVVHGSQHLTVVELLGGMYKFWRSHDGGETWTSSIAFDNIGPTELFQLGPDAYLLRQKTNLLYSGDAGRTYKAVPVDMTFSTHVVVVSDRVAIAPFYLGATITGDGGSTWRVMNPPQPDQSFLRSDFRAQGHLPDFLQIDASTLLSWNWPGNPGVYKSQDLGQTWSLTVGLSPSQSASLTAVLPLNSKVVLAVSAAGDLRQSKDSGRTWAIKMQSPLFVGGTLLRADANTIWFNSKYRSTDGGDSWQEVPGLPALSGMYFLDAKRGWARGPGTDIYATQDGGDSWLPVCQGANCPPAGEWVFRDASNGLLINYTSTYKTADGGKTWSFAAFEAPYVDQPRGYFPSYTLAWPGATQAWASLQTCGYNGSSRPATCQTALLRSSDGGSHWTKANLGIDPYSANSLQFFDTNQGWVYVPSTRMQNFTRDGGQTWTPRPLPFNPSRALKFSDMRTGWALNDQGELFATGTGGAVPAASAASAAAGPLAGSGRMGTAD